MSEEYFKVPSYQIPQYPFLQKMIQQAEEEGMPLLHIPTSTGEVVVQIDYTNYYPRQISCPIYRSAPEETLQPAHRPSILFLNGKPYIEAILIYNNVNDETLSKSILVKMPHPLTQSFPPDLVPADLLNPLLLRNGQHIIPYELLYEKVNREFLDIHLEGKALRVLHPRLTYQESFQQDLKETLIQQMQRLILTTYGRYRPVTFKKRPHHPLLKNNLWAHWRSQLASTIKSSYQFTLTGLKKLRSFFQSLYG